MAFTIAALLVGLSTPMAVKMYDSMKYREAVRSVVSGIHAARYGAMVRGETVDFVVTPVERQFQIGKGEIKRLPESISLTVHAAREVSHGDGTAVIRFYPDGSSSGGSVDLQHESGKAVRLRVDWLLGKLTQEGYAPT